MESELRSLAPPFVEAAVRLAAEATQGPDPHGPAHAESAELAADLWRLAVATAGMWAPWVGQQLLASFLQVGLRASVLRVPHGQVSHGMAPLLHPTGQ